MDHIGLKQLENYEPFKKCFMMPEIGFTLRTLLDDGDEFKVEFLYQINQDQPWSWIGKVTCNGENLTKKVKFMDMNHCFILTIIISSPLVLSIQENTFPFLQA